MRRQKWWLVLGLVLVAGSCGQNDPLGEAWRKFRVGDLAGAHAAFSDLIGSEGSQALVGLGWTTLRMDSLQASNGYFALAAGDSLVAGYAGWALVSWVLEDFPACIQYCDFVIQKQGTNFVFEEDRSVTGQDVLWHQASSYYHLGNYGACIAKIKLIDPSFVEPDLGDPNLEQILLAKLEALGDLLGVST